MENKIQYINLQIEARTKYIMKKIFEAQLSLLMYDYFDEIKL